MILTVLRRIGYFVEPGMGVMSIILAYREAKAEGSQI
jgi:hypothetical protein